jgi:hypothetical protein
MVLLWIYSSGIGGDAGFGSGISVRVASESIAGSRPTPRFRARAHDFRGIDDAGFHQVEVLTLCSIEPETSFFERHLCHSFTGPTGGFMTTLLVFVFAVRLAVEAGRIFLSLLFLAQAFL